MKKILITLMLLICALSIFAEDTYDLSFKFKEKETVKSYGKLSVNGQFMMMENQMQIQNIFDGIVTETTAEITKDKTAKKILTYSVKDVKTNDQTTAQRIVPKSIGYEIDAKGKLYNILNEKGAVTQKVAQSVSAFPEKPIKVGESWNCISNASGVYLNTTSTLKEIKTVDNVKYAVIDSVIDTPIDIPSLMQLMGMTSNTLGAYDQMQMKAYCKGKSESLFDIEKGIITKETLSSVVYLEGYMYNMTVMQGQFNVEYSQNIFTPDDYKKHASN